jgi:acyl dehydratase
MMHGHEKSRSAIVAVKPTNKAERSAAEPVERRAEAEGSVGQQNTHRAQYRASVAQALACIRRVVAVDTRGGNRMRESCMNGSVRGMPSNGHPYRDAAFLRLLTTRQLALQLAEASVRRLSEIRHAIERRAVSRGLCRRSDLRFWSCPHRGDRIKSFAAEFDPQPFHLDEDAARDSIFRGLAASGWHTAALTMRLLVQSELKPAGGIVGAGFDEFRWPHPVRPGDELRVESEIIEVRPSRLRPAQGLIKVRTTTFKGRQGCASPGVELDCATAAVRRRYPMSRICPAFLEWLRHRAAADGGWEAGRYVSGANALSYIVRYTDFALDAG